MNDQGMASAGNLAGNNMSSQGMASGAMRRDEGGMASPAKDWKPDQNNNLSVNDAELGPSFLQRLFFYEDLRLISNSLQKMGQSKTDVLEDGPSFITSDYSFFQLYFRMSPVISININGTIIAMIIYFSTFKISMILAFIITFAFLQIVIFQHAKEIYSLERYKIGEKETGRFIKIVRNVWSLFEFIFVSITIGLGMLYLFHFDYVGLANKILKFQFENNILNVFLTNIKNWIDFVGIANDLPLAVSGLFSVFAFFIATYIIAAYMTFAKYKDMPKKNLFALKKEFLHPADLAREKFEF